jgi:uncharacterized membrane protein YozB (DUF420 family)
MLVIPAVVFSAIHVLAPPQSSIMNAYNAAIISVINIIVGVLAPFFMLHNIQNVKGGLL